ncbi:MAG: hypothetical protein WDM79_12485 [Terricaulis sp.]
MRVLAYAALSMGLILASAPPAAAHRGTGAFSWGKPDIGFTAYRKDAAGCTYSASIAMMSDLADNSSMAGSTNIVSGNSATASQSGAPSGVGDSTLDPMVIFLSGYLVERQRDRRVERDLRQDVIDQCLMELGYQRFRLTDEQRDHLETLEHGSKDRHLYLYSLAIDPAVLTAQAAPLDSDRDHQFRVRHVSE